jgi:transposase
MKRQNFRKLAPAAQEALRVRAVPLILKVGKTQEESAIAVGVSRQRVNIWLRRYRKNGDSEAGDLTGVARSERAERIFILSLLSFWLYGSWFSL